MQAKRESYAWAATLLLLSRCSCCVCYAYLRVREGKVDLVGVRVHLAHLHGVLVLHTRRKRHMQGTVSARTTALTCAAAAPCLTVKKLRVAEVPSDSRSPLRPIGRERSCPLASCVVSMQNFWSCTRARASTDDTSGRTSARRPHCQASRLFSCLRSP